VNPFISPGATRVGGHPAPCFRKGANLLFCSAPVPVMLALYGLYLAGYSVSPKRSLIKKHDLIFSTMSLLGIIRMLNRLQLYSSRSQGKLIFSVRFGLKE